LVELHPLGPAHHSDAAPEDPRARHPGIEVSAEGGPIGSFTTIRAPDIFDGQAETGRRPPPMLDEHGAEIRAEPGMG
jgi:crotonobetainyl-CoA:carnitine CoA-transferase CaiB-like acyl-CoA transferase